MSKLNREKLYKRLMDIGNEEEAKAAIINHPEIAEAYSKEKPEEEEKPKKKKEK